MDYEMLKQKVKVPENSLFPQDYTPQWDKSVQSENEKIWSIEAPIISSTKLSTSHLREKKQWKAAITQKVVIIKNKETQNMEMFVLSLIPDEYCFTKYKHHRGRLYTHAGDKREFSGTAVYTLWEGSNILIREYKNKDVTTKYRHNREKPFDEQFASSQDIISRTGDLVLMSDGAIDLEGVTVIGYPSVCQTCGNWMIFCMCAGGGSWGGYDPPPGYEDPWGGYGNGNDGDGGGGGSAVGGGDGPAPPPLSPLPSTLIEIPQGMFDGKENMKNIVLKVYDLFKDYPANIDIIIRNFIKMNIEANRFIFVPVNTNIVAETTILTNPLRIQITYNTDVFNTANDFALSIVFLHELYHSWFITSNINPSLLPEDLQHWHMANEDGYRGWLELAYPGQTDDFYKAMQYTGTSDCYLDLTPNEQDEIETTWREYGIIY
jgi:hypothetical protein